MNPRVTDVQPRDNYTLNVAFETGELRRFDATPYLDRGVFRRLRKRPLFKAARVVAGSVAWPGEIDLSYDTVYLASNANLFGVTFDPWVGSEYWSNKRSGVRILVLGESHYGTANNVCTTFTSDLVREWTKKGTGRFFSVVSRILLGLDEGGWLDAAERDGVWEHVAFYNYIQELVGNNERVSPNNEMWESAALPFRGILNELKPDLVLVLGDALNGHLPNDLPDRVLTGHVVHSRSSRFTFEAANLVFADLLAKARREARP